MIDVKLKIINILTKNEINYDLTKIPSLNQMYEWTWDNFIDCLLQYTTPEGRIYKGKRIFKIEISDSTEHVDDGAVHGLVFNYLTKEEAIDFINYIKRYKPDLKASKSATLQRNIKR